MASSGVGSLNALTRPSCSAEASGTCAHRPSSRNERRYSTGGRGSSVMASSASMASRRRLRRHSHQHKAKAATVSASSGPSASSAVPEASPIVVPKYRTAGASALAINTCKATARRRRGSRSWRAWPQPAATTIRPSTSRLVIAIDRAIDGINWARPRCPSPSRLSPAAVKPTIPATISASPSTFSRRSSAGYCGLPRWVLSIVTAVVLRSGLAALARRVSPRRRQAPGRCPTACCRCAPTPPTRAPCRA